jgi:hypothetical protein
MPAASVPFCDKGHSGDAGDDVPWVVEGRLTMAPWSSPAQAGRGTMGLLMSDITLIEPMLDETAWLRDGLGAWAYETDVARDAYEYEATEPVAD